MKRKTKIYLFSLLISFIFFLLSFCSISWAESAIDDAVNSIVFPLRNIINAAAVLMIVIGGFEYMTAAGDPGKIGNGKAKIFAALAGFLIAALADVLFGIMGI